MLIVLWTTRATRANVSGRHYCLWCFSFASFIYVRALTHLKTDELQRRFIITTEPQNGGADCTDRDELEIKACDDSISAVVCFR